MYRMNPWGGCGANPLPELCTKLADRLRGQFAGGWPHSEGIYDDINKFFWIRFYWNAGQTTPDVLWEYAAYYFGPEVADDGVRLFGLLEHTPARDGWHVINLAEADQAYEIARAMETRMPAWATNRWRWRIVRLRAEIDHVLKRDGLKSEDGRRILKACRDELSRIYHAEKAEVHIRPPTLRQ